MCCTPLPPAPRHPHTVRRVTPVPPCPPGGVKGTLAYNIGAGDTIATVSIDKKLNGSDLTLKVGVLQQQLQASPMPGAAPPPAQPPPEPSVCRSFSGSPRGPCAFVAAPPPPPQKKKTLTTRPSRPCAGLVPGQGRRAHAAGGGKEMHGAAGAAAQGAGSRHKRLGSAGRAAAPCHTDALPHVLVRGASLRPRLQQETWKFDKQNKLVGT